MTRCANEGKYPVDGLGWTPPDPIVCRLEMERLVVRPYELDDAPELLGVVNENRQHLLPWMPWAKSDHRELAATVRFISSQIMGTRDLGAFAGVALGVFERESGRLLGGTGAHGIRRDTASCEIGYWCRADACGNGYTTEATRAVLSWALSGQAAGGLGLSRAYIYCAGKNDASRRVCEKLGLIKEVHQRADFFVEGVGPTDRLGWGVLAGEWDCKKSEMRVM